MLLGRLKQLVDQKHRVDEQIEREVADEREITDEQIEIQAMLEAKARERANLGQSQPSDYSEEPEPEALPIPAAMVHHEQHPGKRHGMNAVSCEYILLIFSPRRFSPKSDLVKFCETRNLGSRDISLRDLIRKVKNKIRFYSRLLPTVGCVSPSLDSL